MIRDDFREIVRVRAFRDNGGGVWDVLEERAIGKERASGDEDDSCFRSSIAGKIGGGDGAAVLKHDVQNKNFRCVFAKEFGGFALAGDDVYRVILTLQVARPDLR